MTIAFLLVIMSLLCLLGWLTYKDLRDETMIFDWNDGWTPSELDRLSDWLRMQPLLLTENDENDDGI